MRRFHHVQPFPFSVRAKSRAHERHGIRWVRLSVVVLFTARRIRRADGPAAARTSIFIGLCRFAVTTRARGAVFGAVSAHELGKAFALFSIGDDAAAPPRARAARHRARAHAPTSVRRRRRRHRRHRRRHRHRRRPRRRVALSRALFRTTLGVARRRRTPRAVVADDVELAGVKVANWWQTAARDCVRGRGDGVALDCARRCAAKEDKGKETKSARRERRRRERWSRRDTDGGTRIYRARVRRTKRDLSRRIAG